jgi:hypothetical protein
MLKQLNLANEYNHIEDEIGKALKDCEVCIQAKSTKRQNHKPVPRAKRLLERIYMDFWGPYQRVCSMGGYKYYLSFMDDFSRLATIYLTKDRALETVKKALTAWLANAERHTRRKLLIIRTDNAREFAALVPWAKEQGIEIEFTEPYTPAQNGPAERLNRLLLKLTRAILIDANIPRIYWPWALQFACYIRNRTVFSKENKKTPYQLWHRKPAELNKLRVPFCKIWFHIETDDKLEPRAVEEAFVGYCKSTSQYKILSKEDRKIYTVTNPIFMENQRCFLADKAGERDLATSEAFTKVFQPIMPRENSGEISVLTGLAGSILNTESSEMRNQLEESSSTPKPRSSTPEPVRQPVPPQQPQQAITAGHNNQNSPYSTPEPPEPPATTRKSGRVRFPTQAAVESQDTEAFYRRKPRQERRREERESSIESSPRTSQREQAREARERATIRDVARLAVAIELLLGDHDEFAARAQNKRLDNLRDGPVPIPKTYAEAMNHPIYGSKWREAIALEIRTLIQFGTWRYIKRPTDQRVISTKWVFNVKYDGDGRILRFKARIVARGFSQVEGMDYEDTFAPVVRLESLRILFALAALYGLIAHLLDATNAYVRSKLDKRIVMEIPEDVKTYGKDKEVYELLQSLYGLKQSAYLWHKKVQGFITGKGYKQSSADPGVFINERGLIIAVYVDDILIFSRHPTDITRTKQLLQAFHPMKDGGQVSKVLGIRVTWMRNGAIRLDQEFYAKSILEEFGIKDTKAKHLPLSPSINLSDENSPNLNRESHSEFRQIIGKLTYLASGTRPDIQFSVNRLSQHLATPRKVHLEAAKHVLRYVAGTLNYGITYCPDIRGSKGPMGYSDASYANAETSRSTSGYVFLLAGGPIS